MSARGQAVIRFCAKILHDDETGSLDGWNRLGGYCTIRAGFVVLHGSLAVRSRLPLMAFENESPTCADGSTDIDCVAEERPSVQAIIMQCGCNHNRAHFGSETEMMSCVQTKFHAPLLSPDRETAWQ